MIVTDKIYSSFEIKSPVILDLINTQAFQRLKGISQFGIPDQYYHMQGYSRYEHSIGVFILLSKYGASEEECVAGLLHDISHTAFSHLIDWVIGDSSKEDYQDKRHLLVLKQKEIAKILQKYGFSPEGIADYHTFQLLEKDLPDLCADRIDYAFRESSPKVVEQCLPNLKAFKNEFVFTTEESALTFAENFLSRQMDHWAGFEAITRYLLLSDLLSNALESKVISVESFYQTDDFVIRKLKKSGNRKYIERLKLLENRNLEFLDKTTHTTNKKFRYVDPKIFTNGKMARLSQKNKKFSKKLESAKKLNDKGTYTGTFKALNS